MNAQQKRMWQDMLSRSFHPSEWWDSDHNDSQRGGSPAHVAPTRKASSEREVCMWVYKPVEDGSDRWAVGYWTPERVWVQDSLHPTQKEAAQRVHWLNGGSASPEVHDAARRGFYGGS